MRQFYNPYFFLPVLKGRDNEDGQCVEFSSIRKGGHDHIRHDFYNPDCKTGIITCELTTKTPTLVGNRHITGRKNRSPGEVSPYEVNGKPAFPANSLNGMIGSTMEALSNSALRVLEKRPLSVRKSHRKGLSAIGLIVNGENGPMLKPLTMPTVKLKRAPENGRVEFRLESPWADLFAGVPLRECLSIYLHKGSPIAKNAVCRRDYYAQLELDEATTIGNDCITALQKHFKIKEITDKKNRKHYYLLGQTGTVHDENDGENSRSPGRIKKLELKGLTTAQENLHRFERFVPVGNGIDPIPIPKEAIERYTRIAEEANGRDLNFPLTQPAFADSKTELRPGMLVFFDITENNGRIEVSEISHSSIWRELFTPPDTPSAFARIHPNLLPWRGNRTHLTPVEQILGVVAEEDGENGDGAAGGKRVHNLAGRVRFSDARYEKEDVPQQVGPYTLKILASPKPPCPPFYFHDSGNGNSADSRKLLPNGRKYYLLQKEEMMRCAPERRCWWETKEEQNQEDWEKTIHQKIECSLVDQGQRFGFEIHFHNLSDAELGLLLAAIDPVSAETVLSTGNPGSEDGEQPKRFFHRIGLGKPLGLGSVEVKVSSLRIEQTMESYTGWQNAPPSDEEASGIGRYISAAIENHLIDAGVLHVLLKLGDPSEIDAMVTYPVTAEQYDGLLKDCAKGERNLYEWFKNPQKLGQNFWRSSTGFRMVDLKLCAWGNPGNSGNNRGKQRRSKGGRKRAGSVRRKI